MWWPTAFFGILLRGVYSELVGLKPVPWLGPYLIGILLFGTVVCYIQSRKGTLFFLPKAYIPGYHQFVVPVGKIPEERREEECVICYYPLNSLPADLDPSYIPSEANEGVMAHTDSPLVASENQTQYSNPSQTSNPSQPLLRKVKNCMVTPCKHYFHEGCLLAWIERKPECPTCRTKLKFYG